MTAVSTNSPSSAPFCSAGIPDGEERVSRWPIADSEGLVATVHDSGKGMPFVFLHGLVGLNDHWEDVTARVRGNVRCVLFELPLLRLRGDHRWS